MIKFTGDIWKNSTVDSRMNLHEGQGDLVGVGVGITWLVYVCVCVCVWGGIIYVPAAVNYAHTKEPQVHLNQPSPQTNVYPCAPPPT